MGCDAAVGPVGGVVEHHSDGGKVAVHVRRGDLLLGQGPRGVSQRRDPVGEFDEGSGVGADRGPGHGHLERVGRHLGARCGRWSGDLQQGSERLWVGADLGAQGV